jgi:putative RNA 2'-phosphotransferase
MTTPHLVRISKLLALILRHRPGEFGIVLDAEGYAGLDEVLAAVRTRIGSATLADLEAVVSRIEPEKSRYRIADGEIRANYGHSLPGRIEQQQEVPPAVLWHGTPEHALAEISRRGLLPMRRQYVHLTTSSELALRIGARHGRPRLLKVDAARAHADGVAFYRANDAFWLAVQIPQAYLDA